MRPLETAPLSALVLAGSGSDPCHLPPSYGWSEVLNVGVCCCVVTTLREVSLAAAAAANPLLVLHPGVGPLSHSTGVRVHPKLEEV